MFGVAAVMMFGSAGAGVKGDVTGEGVVDVSDLNIMINVILGIETNADYIALSDVTGDGICDVTDLNEEVNIILGTVGPENPGIREGSGTQKFELKLTDLFDVVVANEIHPTVTAVGDYVVVCLGNGTAPVYVDKSTGAKVGTIALGDAEATGCVGSDEAGNLIVTNFADGQGGNFCIWKTNDVTVAPTKILEIPNAWGITLGDYVQVIGNLDGDATIVATYGGLYAQHIARWTVVGGVVNPEPAVVELGGSAIQQIASRDNNFNFAQRTANPADGYFMGQYAGGTDNFYFIEGVGNTVAGSLLPLGTGAEWGLKYGNCYCTTFNGVNYTVLFVMGYWPHWGLPGTLYLFDTDTVDYFDGVNTVGNAPGLVATCDIGDADPDGTTVATDGRVADVKLIPTKDGKYLDLVYTSNTHLTVGCFEFDCVYE